jgi:hypothetical protein
MSRPGSWRRWWPTKSPPDRSSSKPLIARSDPGPRARRRPIPRRSGSWSIPPWPKRWAFRRRRSTVAHHRCFRDPDHERALDPWLVVALSLRRQIHDHRPGSRAWWSAASWIVGGVSAAPSPARPTGGCWISTACCWPRSWPPPWNMGLATGALGSRCRRSIDATIQPATADPGNIPVRGVTVTGFEPAQVLYRLAGLRLDGGPSVPGEGPSGAVAPAPTDPVSPYSPRRLYLHPVALADRASAPAQRAPSTGSGRRGTGRCRGSGQAQWQRRLACRIWGWSLLTLFARAVGVALWDRSSACRGPSARIADCDPAHPERRPRRRACSRTDHPRVGHAPGGGEPVGRDPFARGQARPGRQELAQGAPGVPGHLWRPSQVQSRTARTGQSGEKPVPGQGLARDAHPAVFDSRVGGAVAENPARSGRSTDLAHAVGGDRNPVPPYQRYSRLYPTGEGQVRADPRSARSVGGSGSRHHPAGTAGDPASALSGELDPAGDAPHRAGAMARRSAPSSPTCWPTRSSTPKPAG